MAKTNRQYWIDRAEHREIVSSDHAKQAEQFLAYNYRKAASQIRKEINDFYNRYADENGLTYAEAVREMNRAELLEWRGSVEDYIKQIQTEKNPQVRERLMREYDARSYNSRISRLDGLCGNMNMILDDLYRRSEAEFRELLGREYTDGFYKALYDIQTRFGYSGNFSTIDAQIVENALNYPWSGANFSDRLWKNKEALMSSMREVITQGLIRGDSMPEMTRTLAERLDASLSNAGRLIRTETSHIHNTAEIAAYEAAGYEEYEFVASFGERTCEVCGGLDGQHFKLTDIQYGVNFPPVHPNCRCTTVGWDEADEEPLQLDGQQQIDYEEWKKLYVDDRAEIEIPIQPEPPVPVVPAAQNADNQRLTTGNNSDIIKQEIDKGNIKLEINHDKQARHIKGEPEYTEGRSYLTISEQEAQDIIIAKSGTGILLKDKNGKPVKERIDCGTIIGVDVDMNTGEETPTDKATIHYSKTGTHLVPRKENKNND